jgi:hypothetical protein
MTTERFAVWRGSFRIIELTMLWGAVLQLGLRAAQNTAASPPQAPQLLSSPSRIDPKAQPLLDGAIRALGGPAFLRFKTMTTRGRVYAIEDETTAGLAPYVSAVEYPDKRRFSYGKKQPVTLINNGDQAWELDRYGQTSQRPEQVYRWKISSRYSLENLLRLRIHDPSVLIQPGGVDFVDNVPTQGLDITEPGGTHVKLDLNRQTLLPVRITYRVQNPTTREWDEFADVYGDYRNVQGIMTPMHLTRYLNEERVSETYRNTALYDEDYPAGYFQPTG